MAKKRCSSCNELKSTTKFYKAKKSKDGLQYRCKDCSDKTSKKLLKGDKAAIIYKIVNPLGETYTGKTTRLPQSRWTDHKSRYKYQKQNGKSTFPLLHNSFDIFGVDAHTFEVVLNLGNVSKEELRNAEKVMIQTIKKHRKSLNTYN